ncbi:DUF4350 domain-containing protein [Calothrix sp. FACHB-1219]|uniref:DUF4350 domain-containing protein n=1 Tax=unclassified Calothrix TaxID=2619626 RepID=UPI0016856DB1|nr:MULTISPECIES: DUF4350 domain-containing protein [unclassified Calothrix]MBD2207959.1 DUF4350 domain-containing protein [Calothrix sp. FACHB-168]MBD2222511.1 DUF4350 domain-containing protein [Calothrix sp. FACHB-1219]
MQRANRLSLLGAIALVAIVIISLFAAPRNSILNSGSTYNRSADGYGAWYAFMQEQGSSIQRWQKPWDHIKAKTPVTLLQVYSRLNYAVITSQESAWIEKGNTWVILGAQYPVTAAKFQTMQQSPVGDVKIDTRRRSKKGDEEEILLGDRFGTIVGQTKYGKGKIIFCTTPYLAANAYQDYLSNFKFLADLVSKQNNPIFVDEYIHGYKDADTRQKEGQGDLLTYFTNQPLIVAILPAGIFLLVLIWAQNRRFGKPIVLETPVLDNSEAYIQALAGVLQKAESSDFVVEMVGKEEQLQLQKSLGLGEILLEPQALIDIWVEKTGRSAAELVTVLKFKSSKRSMSDKELLSWLGKWQKIKNNS